METVVSQLRDQVQFAAAGIVSKQVARTPESSVVLFCMDAGQELSEHTAAAPASIIVLEGSATIVAGDETVEARPGTFLHMPAHLSHSVQAKEPLVFLLTLFKPG